MKMDNCVVVIKFLILTYAKYAAVKNFITPSTSRILMRYTNSSNPSRILKNIILLLLFVCTSLHVKAETKFNTNIAIVDVQVILEHSLAVGSIRKSIDFISENIQKEVSKKEAELKKVEEELLKKRDSLTEEEFNKEVADFNKKVSAAQKDLQNKKLHLEQAHGEAIQKVHAKTIEIISQLSEKYNFNLVLPSSQILFAKDNLNITQEVLKSLNDNLKTVKVNYMQH